jgi:hypothetical protein
MLYSSEPRESVWPSISILQLGYFLTNSSAFLRSATSAFRMADLAVSKLTWIVSLAVGTGFARTSTLAESVREPPVPLAVSV